MSRLPTRISTLALAVAKTAWRAAPSAHKPVKRILVAHYLLLGDTLLLAPLLAKLARRYPEAERYVLARPAMAPLFSEMPYGFKVIPFDPRKFDLFRSLLSQGPFDLAFVLGDNRYAWLARAAGARWIVGFENDRPAWKNWMVDELKPNSKNPVAWADMAANLAEGPAPPTFQIGDWPSPAAPAFDLPQRAYAVLHVGASTPLKLWPADRWREIATTIQDKGFIPVWSCGAGESGLIDEIDADRRFLRYSGNLNLAQLWQLLAGADLLVCPDTGIAHLGKIVGTPTVALFGPGSPTIYGKGGFWENTPFHAMAQDPFPCRDQTTLFRREISWVRRCGRSLRDCPTPGLCMQAIAVDPVKKTILDILEGRGIAVAKP